MRLIEVDIRKNMFSGDVDWNVFENMDELTKLELSGNQFTGTVDLGGFKNLNGIRDIRLESNNWNATNTRLDFRNFITNPSIRLEQKYMCDDSIYCDASNGFYSTQRAGQIQCSPSDPLGEPGRCDCTCQCTNGNGSVFTSTLCYGKTFNPTPPQSLTPTIDPTMQPSIPPTIEQSLAPTKDPTMQPTKQPTTTPTMQPTMQQTMQPTMQPIINTTMLPTMQPTVQPLKATFNMTSTTSTANASSNITPIASTAIIMDSNAKPLSETNKIIIISLACVVILCIIVSVLLFIFVYKYEKTRVTLRKQATLELAPSKNNSNINPVIVSSVRTEGEQESLNETAALGENSVSQSIDIRTGTPTVNENSTKTPETTKQDIIITYQKDKKNIDSPVTKKTSNKSFENEYE